jgi:hypothetical protein
VWLYHVFSLDLRDVELILTAYAEAWNWLIGAPDRTRSIG